MAQKRQCCTANMEVSSTVLVLPTRHCAGTVSTELSSGAYSINSITEEALLGIEGDDCHQPCGAHGGNSKLARFLAVSGRASSDERMNVIVMTWVVPQGL
jgi:hypothetical protein